MFSAIIDKKNLVLTLVYTKSIIFTTTNLWTKYVTVIADNGLECIISCCTMYASNKRKHLKKYNLLLVFRKTCEWWLKRNTLKLNV